MYASHLRVCGHSPQVAVQLPSRHRSTNERLPGVSSHLIINCCFRSCIVSRSSSSVSLRSCFSHRFIMALVATFWVAKLTLQTRKLWLVGRCRYLLTCPNVKNLLQKENKMRRNESNKKQKQENMKRNAGKKKTVKKSRKWKTKSQKPKPPPPSHQKVFFEKKSFVQI